MKYEYREDGEPEGPLILIAPASNLVAILSLDWLDHTNEPAVSAKPHGWKNLANRRATREDFEGDSSGTPSTPSGPAMFGSSLSIPSDGSIMMQ
jgi:hypothetical protein